MRNLIAFWLLIGGSGCGSEAPVEVTIDFDQADLDERLQSATCTHLVQCGQFADMATCMTANIGIRASLGRPFLMTPSVTAALRAGKMVFDESNAEECFELIAMNTCDHTDMIGRPAAFAKPYPAVCYSMVRGTVRVGEACAFGAECVSEQCETAFDCEASCCMSTCFGDAPPQPRVAIGEGCNQYTPCVDGAYCHNWAGQGSSECRAFISQGERCDGLMVCDYGLDCVGMPGTEICKPLPLIGEPCPDARCRDEGVVCNAAAICAPAGLPGAPCVAHSDCSRFYVCDETNQCARGPSLGDSCAMHPCFDANTFCDGTTCMALMGDGAAGCFGKYTGLHPDRCQSNECVGSYPYFRCGTSTVCF